MYSTSSSECECDEYCTCDVKGFGTSSYGKTPFYPTMGHPLVYYAQVPQLSKRQRSRENTKDNRNCFAKAFKWYTEEHVPYRSFSPQKTEMNAFAVWLDSKYNEFLRDSQLDNVYHLKMKQTSFIEAERIPDNTCCEPRPKRFRVKSPWRKKRHSKESADTIHKPNHSFQFILQPKDLTPSECCQQSNATMTSTEIPMESNIKSQSYTLISHGLDTKPCDANKCDAKAEISKKVISFEMRQNKALQSISCQCSVVKVDKTNAQSQYEDTDTKTVADDIKSTPGTPADTKSSKMCCYCQLRQEISSAPNNEIPKAPVLTTKETLAKMPAATHNNAHELQCQCSNELIPKADSQVHHRTPNAKRGPSLSNIQSSSKIKTCPCEIKEVLKIVNPAYFPPPVTFSNGGVQTSDHSIHLEKDAAREYALFMKIICADKLCK